MTARKIYVDQQVRIVIQELRIMPRGKAEPEALAFAVGEIEYPEPDAPTGWLIYLKPSYLAVAPIGVRAYAETHQEFPHESTVDQWFSESQFESYRSLGESLIESLDSVGPPPRSIEEFFCRVRTAAARRPAPVPEAKTGPQEAPVLENP
jgi:hypothetical protein